MALDDNNNYNRGETPIPSQFTNYIENTMTNSHIRSSVNCEHTSKYNFLLLLSIHVQLEAYPSHSISIQNASFPNIKVKEVTRHILHPNHHNKLRTNTLQRCHKSHMSHAMCFLCDIVYIDIINY